MAGSVTRRSSLDEIKKMRAKSLTKATPADAPEIELDEAFWRNARIVQTATHPKASVHLRIDRETIEFFRLGGKGHLTRMAKVLKAYAERHGAPPTGRRR